MTFVRNWIWLTVLLILAGCETKTPGTTKAAKPATVSATADDVLSSAVHQLRPENFGINANVDKPVSLLNSWRIKHFENGSTADQSAPVNAPVGWVLEEQEGRLGQARFDIQDAVHIRDAMFYHVIAGYLSDRGRSELGRIGIVVDFVCRNVALWNDDEFQLPLKPFLSLQFGRGSAEDRAWVCAEILRQLRLDSVIVRAKSDTKESSEKWLFGVLVDGKVYLYDLRLGLPIPDGSVGESASPATLDQIKSHADWLELLSVKGTYALTVDDLRDPTISLISDPNFWSQRMHRLEDVWPASESCIIYEPLLGQDSQPGLRERIAKVGGWNLDDIKLWDYPRQQDERSHQPSPEGSQAMQMLTLPMIVPIPIKKGPDGKIVQGTPEGKLQRIRTEQLLGLFADATKRYLSIRHLEVEPNPPEIERLNRMASEDAFFWTSICKVEMDDHPAAIEQLTAYLKKYERKGKWYFAARSTLAQSQAQMGDLVAAISTLERTSSEDPYRQSNAIRLQRWTAAKAK